MIFPHRGLLLAALVTFSGGCSSNAPTRDVPKTYPVVGTVMRADGSPFPGGSIQFRPKARSTVTIIGDIDEKGYFTMRSVGADGKLEGTPEGEYDVIVTPISLSQEEQVQSITLAKTVVIRPGEKNELALKLD